MCVLLYRSSRLEVFSKKCALKTSQNSQKNTCVGVPLLKRRLQRSCFPVSFAKFFRTSFSQNTSRACFCNSTFLIMKSSSKSTIKQVVLGGFWVASEGFCWLWLISVGFRWFGVLVVTRTSQHTQELFLYCTHERT